MLLPENLTTLVTVHAERSRVAKRASQSEASMLASASNSNMSPPKRTTKVVDAELLEDEDNRAKKIFLHLEALCTTSEARRSLYLWQLSYAQRMGKEFLLPRCTTPEDKSWMGRILRRGEEASKRSNIISVP